MESSSSRGSMGGSSVHPTLHIARIASCCCKNVCFLGGGVSLGDLGGGDSGEELICLLS